MHVISLIPNMWFTIYRAVPDHPPVFSLITANELCGVTVHTKH